MRLLQSRRVGSPRSPAPTALKNNVNILRRQSEPLIEEFEFDGSFEIVPSPAKRARKSMPSG